MRAKKAKGSIVFNPSRSMWNHIRPYRQLGPLQELPTREDAERKWNRILREEKLQAKRSVIKVGQIVEDFRHSLRYPERKISARVFEAWVKNHILPKWQDLPITEVRAQPVENWLASLPLAPTSRRNVKKALYKLWEYALWAEYVDVERNPIRSVKVKNLSLRVRPAVNMTFDEFKRWILELEDPFRTIVLVSLGCGLRISETLALRWLHIFWLESRISLEKGVVEGVVDELKTPKSKKKIHASPVVLKALENWRRESLFQKDEDWVFASPHSAGRMPYTRRAAEYQYKKAAAKIGLKRLSTHSMRHTARSWLDAVNVKPTIMKEVMRWTNFQTAYDTYGDVVTDEEREAFNRLGGMIDTALIPASAKPLKTLN